VWQDVAVSAVDLIAAGRRALDAGDWAAARELFEESLKAGESAESLDGLGQALWWQNQLVQALELRERAYTEFARRGESARAGAIAVFLAREYFFIRGNFAAANGWLARAETLFEEAGPCPERVWLEITRGRLATDHGVMEEHAREAIALAQRFGDRDLEILGLSLLGLSLIHGTRIREGMTLLDEAMAAATGGEVKSLWAIADVFCNTLTACERASDFERAEQWCQVVTEFVRKHGCQPMFPFCNVTYGMILMATGRWEEAERELLLAVDAFSAGQRAMRVLAVGYLADLWIRQGRAEEARALLEEYPEHPLALRPAVRLLIADGQAALAAAMLERRLAAVGTDSLLAAPVLGLLVEACLAVGDSEKAIPAAEALVKLANAAGQPALEAEALFATGRARRAAGADGLDELGRALELFSRLELPYEAGRVRLELAAAIAAGQPKVALGEARLALSLFDRLGAARDADRAAELVRRLGGGTRPGPRRERALTAREEEILELVASGLSNREISERLFLSVKTVEHHVSRVLGKLGLKRRAEAAAALIRRKGAEPSSRG
jgi:DNA-binding CsgD family transcriptional regulator